MSTPLAEILRRRDVWRADRGPERPAGTLASGWSALDAELPGRGWERGAVTECLVSGPGCGELSLLLPALARLSQEERTVVLVAPPYVPYAPAWQAAGVVLSRLVWLAPATGPERLWAFEQSLREPACGAVLGWFGPALADTLCRRLQLAASVGDGLGFLVRSTQAESLSSPFHLRLGLSARAEGLSLRLLKRPGRPLLSPILLTNPGYASPHVVAGPTLSVPAPGRVPARPRPVLA